MGAADEHLGAALGDGHVHHIHLHHLTLGEGLARHLLVLGQVGLAALAQIQGNHAAQGVDAGDGAGDDLMRLGLHLGELLVALGLADALPNHVLGGHSGNAAELLGLEGGHQPVAGLQALAELMGLGHAHLGVRVLHLFHHVPHQGHIELALGRVDLHQNVVVLHLVVLLHGDDDGVADALDEIIGGQAALFFQHGQGFKKLCVHFSGILP